MNCKKLCSVFIKILLIFCFLIVFCVNNNLLAREKLFREDINLYLEMVPRMVRLQIKSGEFAHQDLIYNLGLYVEGHQSQPEKLVIQPDSLTATYRKKGHSVQLGYFRPSWGTEFFSSIMLSGNFPSLPGFHYQIPMLDYFSYERFGVRFPANRGDFFGHRLEIKPQEGVKVGLKETVIFTDDFSGYYLNLVPMWPFYLLKYIPAPPTNIDNMNVGLDITLDLIKNFSFYGDFHVTEWPFVPESKQPHVYGLQLGMVHKNLLAEDANLIFEYQRLMNYLYSARVEGQYYEYGGFPLGSELGPDAEQFKMILEYPVTDNFDFIGGLRWGRKGQGKLGDYWDDPEDDGIDSIDEARDNIFMTGVVEKRLASRAGFNLQLDPNVELGLELEAEFTRNHEHQKDKKGTRTWGHLEVNYQF